MANKHTQTAKNEELHKARMLSAVTQIADSPELRYFMRQLLMDCGDHTTPAGGNAIETAHLCGRHSVGKDLIAIFLEYDYKLYPLLIAEDLEEHHNNEGDDYAVD